MQVDPLVVPKYELAAKLSGRVMSDEALEQVNSSTVSCNCCRSEGDDPIKFVPKRDKERACSCLNECHGKRDGQHGEIWRLEASSACK